MRVLFKAVFALIFIAGLSMTAQAQSTSSTPGCNDTNYKAMQDARRAQNAVGVAGAEGIYTQPDSVLATSCFDQAARVSAQEGGQIFSGPFFNEMAPVVMQPMQNLLSVNFLGSIGKDPDFGQIVTTVLTALLGGIFGGGMSGGSFDCPVQQDLYDAALIQGINPNVLPVSIDEAISLVLNGNASTNDRFMAGLMAASQIFQDAQNSVNAIPAPTAPPSSQSCSSSSNPFNCILSLYGY